MLEEYKKWTGNLDDLRSVSYTIVNEYVIENIEEQYSVRLIRDYISRGLLGSTERAGKELFFKYENLLRFIVVRAMLADGWSLTKIQDQLSLSTLNEIEEILPSENIIAIEKINNLRATVRSASRTEDYEEKIVSLQASMLPEPSALNKKPKFSLRERLLSKARKTTAIQKEMKDALNKLGIPGDGPQMEDLKLIALAPWCQVLITEERFEKLTVQEAKDLGEAFTASLTAKILMRGGRK